MVGVRAGRLPVEVTSFVGRQKELASAKRLLERSRLVTLTGVGGVGKTRLALRVAGGLVRAYRDGVRLVDLTQLTDPDLLVRHVAEAVGLPDMSARADIDTLIEYLQDRHMLMVLDNCEHVIEAAGMLVGALLPATRQLRVLVTSRHLLGVPGEHPLWVTPLSVPQDVAPGEALPLRHYESVTLLAERAAAAGFEITEANRDAVARLCRRLDGLPLAIELAAVRLGTLSIYEVLDRLEDRFRFLSGRSRITPPYHRTLRGVVDWSYELCDPAQQRLWARLSVFSGGFDLDAVESVCSGDGIERDDIVDLLAELVHQSLVVADRRGRTARYRMLETIREYGRARLEDFGETPTLRRRHRDYYQGIAVWAGEDWFSPREVEWMERLTRDVANIRTALAYCLSEPGEAHAGLAIAIALTRARAGYFMGDVPEGRAWLDRAHATDQQLPPALRAVGLALTAWVSLFQGDNDGASTILDSIGVVDDATRPIVLYIRGAQLLLGEAKPDAIEVLIQARDVLRAAGARGDAHMAALFLAIAQAFCGRAEDARAAAAEVQAEAEVHQATWAISWAWWVRGLCELRHGDPHQAGALLRESLRQQRDIPGDRWGPLWNVIVMALVAAHTGNHTYTAQMLGAAQKLSELTGIRVQGMKPFASAYAEAEKQVRAALGAKAYTVAYDQGYALSWDDAVNLASRRSSATSAPSRSTSADESSPTLTPRESEVAVLVAKGLSNQRIAEALVISTRTAETHVANILKKLNFEVREQIAAWALREHPDLRS